MTASPNAAPGNLWLSVFLQRTWSNLIRWIGAVGRAPRGRAPSWPTAATIAIVLTLVVIVAAMFLIDSPVTDWARNLPRAVIGPADEITNYGRSGWFLYPLAILFVVLAMIGALSLPPFAQDIVALFAARVGFLFTAIALPSLFDTIIKRLIGRARPYVYLHDNPFAYMPFVWRPEYASMPSGHATTVAAAAIAFGAIWPRLRPVMWLYALIIMATRIIIDVHHPSDVLAGALVGIVGAFLVRRWFATRDLAFSPDLRPLPGPSWRTLKEAVRSVFHGPTASAD